MNMIQESELRGWELDANVIQEWNLLLETHTSSLWIKILTSEGVEFLSLDWCRSPITWRPVEGLLDSEVFYMNIIGGEGWDRHSSNYTSSHAQFPAHSRAADPQDADVVCIWPSWPLPQAHTPICCLLFFCSRRFIIITGSAIGEFKELRV